MFFTPRPVTEARLPSALELKLMLPVSIQVGSSFVLEWPQGIKLGTIGRMTRTQNREVKRRYSLGKHSFEPYDIIPGRITTSLRLEKVVLYSEYVTKVSVEDIISQVPLVGGTAAGLLAAFGVTTALGLQTKNTLTDRKSVV